MGTAAGWLLLAAAIAAAVIAATAWLALRRPARRLERRRREQALAAAERVTPASRVSPYGAPPAPDPCAPGLSDQQRVEAMRAMLLRGTGAAAASAATASAPLRDDTASTAPMAWNPTLPPDEADAAEALRRDGWPRLRDADHEHITVF